jgi:hypothetical protein
MGNPPLLIRVHPCLSVVAFVWLRLPALCPLRLRKPAKEAGTNLENESKNPDKSGKIRVNPAKSG